jgi:protein CWC15
MTTAHRPTWKAAVGQASEGGWAAGGARSTAVSNLDAPAHTALKIRKGAQVIDKKAALQQSLLELKLAEATIAKALPGRLRGTIDPAEENRAQQRLLTQTADVDVGKLKDKYDDSDVDGGGQASDDSSDLDAESDLDSSDSDDDDEDEEAALQAELAKIRAEREGIKRKADAEAAAEEESKQEESALLGNPLLAAGATSGRMKRRWNDDIVFRNQAKGEPAPKKRFINDTVRNDFHKRFLHKFIR